MDPVNDRKDRAAFLKALTLWNRPESELYGQCLPRDTDTDALIDRLFSSPARGFIRD